MRWGIRRWWWWIAGSRWPTPMAAKRRGAKRISPARSTRTSIAISPIVASTAMATGGTPGPTPRTSPRGCAHGASRPTARWSPATPVMAVWPRRGCGSCCARWGTNGSRCSTADLRAGRHWGCRWMPRCRSRGRPITTASSIVPCCSTRWTCNAGWTPARCCSTRVHRHASVATASRWTRPPDTCRARATARTPTTLSTAASSRRRRWPTNTGHCSTAAIRRR